MGNDPKRDLSREVKASRQFESLKEDLESDSGHSSLCLVVEHIQRNILVCALCKQLFTQPKVRTTLQYAMIMDVQLSNYSCCPACTHSALPVCGTLLQGKYLSIRKIIMVINIHYSSSLTISCPDCGHTSILPPEGVRNMFYHQNWNFLLFANSFVVLIFPWKNLATCTK